MVLGWVLVVDGRLGVWCLAARGQVWVQFQNRATCVACLGLCLNFPQRRARFSLEARVDLNVF